MTAACLIPAHSGAPLVDGRCRACVRVEAGLPPHPRELGPPRAGYKAPRDPEATGGVELVARFVEPPRHSGRQELSGVPGAPQKPAGGPSPDALRARSERLALGWSQRVLEVRARLPHKSVSNFERGLWRPSRPVLDRVFAALASGREAASVPSRAAG